MKEHEQDPNGQDRCGRFFLKRRGERGIFRICWYDGASRQTSTISTRTTNREEARRALWAHAARAERVRSNTTMLGGCELPPVDAGSELPSAERIVSMATRHYHGAGVYFLILGTSIVYVGQSRRARARVQQHALEGSYRFDRYLIMPCSPEDLRRVEAHYIRAIEPRYNVVRGNRVNRNLSDEASCRV